MWSLNRPGLSNLVKCKVFLKEWKGWKLKWFSKHYYYLRCNKQAWSWSKHEISSACFVQVSHYFNMGKYHPLQTPSFIARRVRRQTTGLLSVKSAKKVVCAFLTVVLWNWAIKLLFEKTLICGWLARVVVGGIFELALYAKQFKK